MVANAEQLRAKLDAYVEFNQPDELAIENIGESIEAQLAIQSFVRSVEERREERVESDEWLKANQSFEELVTRAVAVLHATNRQIEIHNPDDLALARRIQAHAIWYMGDSIKNGQYIAGSKKTDKKTDLLLIPQCLEKAPDDIYAAIRPLRGIYPGTDFGRRVKDMAEQYKLSAGGRFGQPWTIRTVSTKYFNEVLAAAKLRESQPFSEEELIEMNKKDGEVDVELDGEAVNSIKFMYSGADGPAGVSDDLYWSKRILQSIGIKDKTANSAPLIIHGHESVKVLNCIDIVKSFGVLDHVVDLATNLGRVEEVEQVVDQLTQ